MQCSTSCGSMPLHRLPCPCAGMHRVQVSDTGAMQLISAHLSNTDEANRGMRGASCCTGGTGWHSALFLVLSWLALSCLHPLKLVLGCRWLLFPPPLPSYQALACCVLLAPHCIAPWTGLYVQCVHIKVSVALLLLLLYADAGASVSTGSCRYCIHHPHGSSELPIVQPFSHPVNGHPSSPSCSAALVCRSAAQ